MYLPFTSLLAATPLVTWLKSVPKCFVHPGIDIDTSENGAGLGTFMREPVKAGEMLFSIPTSACISVTDAALDAECGEKFLQMVESGVPRTVGELWFTTCLLRCLYVCLYVCLLACVGERRKLKSGFFLYGRMVLVD